MPDPMSAQRLTNLKVLASLASGDKLDVSGNVFTRQRYFTGLQRTFSSQSASSYERPIFQLFWDEIVKGLEDDVCNTRNSVRVEDCNAAFEGVKNLQQTYRISDKVSFFTGSTRKDKNADNQSIDKFQLLGNLIAQIAPLIKVVEQLPSPLIFLYRGGPTNKTAFIPNELINKRLDPIVSLKNRVNQHMISPAKETPNGDWVTDSFILDQSRSQMIYWNCIPLPNRGMGNVGNAVNIIKGTVGAEGLFALSQLFSQAGLIGICTKFAMGHNELSSPFAISNHLKVVLQGWTKNNSIHVTYFKGKPNLDVLILATLDLAEIAMAFPLGGTGQEAPKVLNMNNSPLSMLQLSFGFKVWIPSNQYEAYEIETTNAIFKYSCKLGNKTEDNPSNIFS